MQNFIRNTAVAYLMILVLFKMLAVPFIVLDYEVNKDYIANYLCVNKGNTVAYCYGKCHLTKELAKAAEAPVSNEKNNARPATVDFVEHFEPFSFEAKQPPVSDHNLFRDNRFTVFSLHSIFHPPAFA
ncbi:hypothetical protein HHL16_13855 [Pseudoflavitalea sp. G-6-1-2]|uniref:hypothetical protein n=1 Tax=Pseudoflavitalea sp. G-6-1-2 TaxID=2728841 RepID=UPI00146B90C8|nr:hypothetical protein [Pseudoflavitalea sp. G-6-1-2]NML21969.1 hypothetical protein [Pseudoflavitalea sp. G-6-1-2]